MSGQLKSQSGVVRYGNSLADRPTASAFGKGELLIVDPTKPGYWIRCTSDGVSWASHGSSDSIADRPSAALLGKGSWQETDNNVVYYTDGIGWLISKAISIYNSPAAKLAAQLNHSRIVTEYANATPDIYFDSSLTTGTGLGTSAANACRTNIELQVAVANTFNGSAVNLGRMAGYVIGFKRGTVIKEPINISVLNAGEDRPVVITGYGIGANPIIDLGKPDSGWVVDRVQSGKTIWKKFVEKSAGVGGYEPRWQDNVRIREYDLYSTPATVDEGFYVNLAAAGEGYFRYAADHYMYAIPRGNADPNTAFTTTIHPVSTVSAIPNGFAPVANGMALTISLSDSGSQYGNLYAGPNSEISSGTIAATGSTGHFHICGIDVTKAIHSGIYIYVGSTANKAQRNISITNCSISNIGNSVVSSSRSGQSAPGDGILINANDETSVIRDPLVSGNYFYDVGNNSVETSLTNGLIVEYNVAKDVIGHGIVEHWSSTKNSITRYNISDNRGLEDWVSNGEPVIGFHIWLAANTGAANTTQNSALTYNNSYLFNLCLGGYGDAFRDSGGIGTKIFNNTFVSKRTSVLQFNPDNNAAVTGDCYMANNLVVSTVVNPATKITYIDSSLPATYTVRGDNNIFARTGITKGGTAADGLGKGLDVFQVNNVDYNTIALFAAQQTGFEQTSNRVVGVSLNENGMPEIYAKTRRYGRKLSGSKLVISGVTGVTLSIYSPIPVHASGGNIKLTKNGMHLPRITGTGGWTNDATTITLGTAAIATDVFEVITNEELYVVADLNGQPIIGNFVGCYQHSPITPVMSY